MDLKSLTLKQRQLLKKIYLYNYLLVNNEGKNYKCWLEDRQGNFIETVRKDSANKLVSQGWFQEAKGKNVNLFYNELTEKANKKIYFVMV